MINSFRRNFRNRGGFTVMEMLVVVALIGILATIVLIITWSARDLGNDAKVKDQLSNMRTAAENFYTSQRPPGYGTPNSNSACVGTDAAGSVFSDQASGMLVLSDQSNYPSGTTLVCNNTRAAWAVQANLKTSGHYWCVDSTGNSTEELIPLGASILCP